VMREIWIIGIGQFGWLAAQRLSRRNADTRFLLVDPDEKNLSRAEGPRRTLIKEDGVGFLYTALSERVPPDWIIPALPLHLAAEWSLLHLNQRGWSRREIPGAIHPLLPTPLVGSSGDVYVSHARFRCPDDCAEPRGLCTVTQEKRKRNMFELLADLPVSPFQPLVIRSHQLGPGIGGYRPRQLTDLLSRLETAPPKVLVCTACRCHGVLTALERKMQKAC
jgi:hypothetical protein